MSDLLFEVRDGVARFTINRPESLNAMRAGMWPQLADMVRSVEHNPDVRCVLITGTGANFCAGGDVKEMAATLSMTAAERAETWMRSADLTNALFLILERMPQPVLVSARGIAAGGGMGLVLAADLAIVSENTRLFAAQIKLGAIPDSAVAYNLTRHMGVKRVKQLSFLGDKIDARTALDFGIVNWVVPDAELETRTDEIAVRLAETPRTAVARTKAEINNAGARTLADHFVQEALDVGACIADDDFPKNVRAVLDRIQSR